MRALIIIFVSLFLSLGAFAQGIINQSSVSITARWQYIDSSGNSSVGADIQTLAPGNSLQLNQSKYGAPAGNGNTIVAAYVMIGSTTIGPYTTTLSSVEYPNLAVEVGNWNGTYGSAARFAFSGGYVVVFNKTSTPPTFPIPVILSLTTDKTSGPVPLAVNFSAAVQSSGGGVWRWNFGDGTTSTAAGSVSHTYTVADNYVPTLDFYDYGGHAYRSARVNAGVAGAAPVPSFSVDVSSGPSPLVVHFTDTSIGNPVAWAWQFGSLGTSSLQNPSFTFSDPGNYSCVLMCQNEFGWSMPFTVVITVNPPPIVGDFQYTPQAGNAPLTVSFTASYSGADSFLWDFADGSSANGAFVNHTFQNDGSYVVKCTAHSTQYSTSLVTSHTIVVSKRPVSPDGSLILRNNSALASYYDTLRIHVNPYSLDSAGHFSLASGDSVSWDHVYVQNPDGSDTYLYITLPGGHRVQKPETWIDSSSGLKYTAQGTSLNAVGMSDFPSYFTGIVTVEDVTDSGNSEFNLPFGTVDIYTAYVCPASSKYQPNVTLRVEFVSSATYSAQLPADTLSSSKSRASSLPADRYTSIISIGGDNHHVVTIPAIVGDRQVLTCVVTASFWLLEVQGTDQGYSYLGTYSTDSFGPKSTRKITKILECDTDYLTNAPPSTNSVNPPAQPGPGGGSPPTTTSTGGTPGGYTNAPGTTSITNNPTTGGSTGSTDGGTTVVIGRTPGSTAGTGSGMTEGTGQAILDAENKHTQQLDDIYSAITNASGVPVLQQWGTTNSSYTGKGADVSRAALDSGSTLTNSLTSLFVGLGDVQQQHGNTLLDSISSAAANGYNFTVTAPDQSSYDFAPNALLSTFTPTLSGAGWLLCFAAGVFTVYRMFAAGLFPTFDNILQTHGLTIPNLDILGVNAAGLAAWGVLVAAVLAMLLSVFAVVSGILIPSVVSALTAVSPGFWHTGAAVWVTYLCENLHLSTLISVELAALFGPYAVRFAGYPVAFVIRLLPA